jgi:hypothetical protein
LPSPRIDTAAQVWQASAFNLRGKGDAMKTATIGIALAMLAASGAAQGAECVNA